jgi:hypothetical protein
MPLELYEAALHDDSESHVSEDPPAPQKTALPKLNTSVALWLVLFVFGGGLLALYYAGIGYFPEVTWQHALTFMALMTIIGGGLLVAYSFLLFVPGAIWSEFLIFDKQLHQVLMMGARRWEPCVWSVTKQILFPFAVFMAFCHFLLYEDGPSGSVLVGAVASLITVSVLLVRTLREGLEVAARRRGNHSTSADPVPNTSRLNWHRLSVGLSHVPLLAAFIAKAGYSARPGDSILWAAALLPLASCFGLLIDSQIERRSSRRASGSVTSDSNPPLAHVQGRVADKLSLLCRASLAFGSAALLSLMALWFFHRIYKGGASETQGIVPWGLLVMCTLVVIVTNLAVSVLFHQHRRQALLASFLAALLLLGAGQLLGTKAEARLPAKIMEEFGFGGQSATLVLTERGGRLLCQQGVPVEFEERRQSKVGVVGGGEVGDADAPQETPGGPEKAIKGKPPEEGLFARADGLTILSRLGSEYLLRFGEETTIALPKGEVVSWSTNSKSRTLVDGCKPPGISNSQ